MTLATSPVHHLSLSFFLSGARARSSFHLRVLAHRTHAPCACVGSLVCACIGVERNAAESRPASFVVSCFVLATVWGFDARFIRSLPRLRATWTKSPYAKLPRPALGECCGIARGEKTREKRKEYTYMYAACLVTVVSPWACDRLFENNRRYIQRLRGHSQIVRLATRRRSVNAPYAGSWWVIALHAQKVCSIL